MSLTLDTFPYTKNLKKLTLKDYDTLTLWASTTLDILGGTSFIACKNLISHSLISHMHF